MSLILAIDPDSRHAAQLQSMARTHLRAELVMADSADHAVAAMAQRVPDIVLTAPLLPGRDEALLAKYLRALGAAAAHVQTLTIPIFSGAAAAPARTMLGRFLRDRPRTEDDDGCDPAMFADQIGQYLRRARQSRGEVPADRQQMPAPAATPSSARAPAPAPPLPPSLPVMRIEEPLPVMRIEEEEAEDEGAAEMFVAEVMPHVMHRDEPEAGDATGARVGDSSDDDASDGVIEMEVIPEDVDLSELLNELSAPDLSSVPLPPVQPVTSIPSRSVQSVALSRTRPKTVEPPRFKPAWFDGEVLAPAVIPRAARADEPRYRANEAPPSGVQQHMITIPSGDGGYVQASVNVSVAVAVQVSSRTGMTPPSGKRRPRAPKPPQDEWGFFDPDQCGFRALIARLDAIAEVDEAD